MEDTVHATASIPVQNDRRTQHLWGRPAMTPRFVADTQHHQMKILHDEGLYRHLAFGCQPIPYASPTTGNCAFQLFTAPGTLGISGDMGTYIFARLENMFVFFDSPEGRINPDYWSEKVTAQDVHSPVRAFSQQRFREVVLQDYEDRKYLFDPATQKHLLHKIRTQVLDAADTYHEVGSRDVLREFVFYDQKPGQPRLDFDYEQSWEWDFKDFSHHFLWCLEAIVFGIKRYREVTGRV